MAIEFVDLPSYKMGGFSHQFFVCLPEGTPKIQHGTDSQHMADEFPNMENDHGYHGDLGEVSWYLSLMVDLRFFHGEDQNHPAFPTSEVPAGSVLGCVSVGKNP